MRAVKENKGYVTAEYLKKRAGSEEAVNQESYRMLNIEKGMQVLEVGCGPSTTASVFCEAAHASGFVIGVDYDAGMLQHAKAEAKHYVNLMHLQGDAHRLPFEDDRFDRVYAKRLFQVLPPSSAPIIFAEMERVLKPGGVIVLVDTDWTSVAINYSDLELERRLVGFFRDNLRPNGLAGRQLLTLLQQGRFVDVDVKVMTIAIHEFDETPFGDWLINEALKAKVATVEEMGRWRSELEQKSAEQAFLFHVGTVLVAAKKKN